MIVTVWNAAGAMTEGSECARSAGTGSVDEDEVGRAANDYDLSSYGEDDNGNPLRTA